jgi:lysophospholipase L1-like esterase
MRRRALLLSAPLLLGAGPPSAPPRHAEGVRTLPQPVAAARPLSRMDLPWWRARHEAVLARLREGPADLLLIGDSITQNLELRGPEAWRDFTPVWQRFYAGRNAVNLGFKGDTTASVIWRLRNGELPASAPKVAQVLIGANNFGRVHWSAEDTRAGIVAILAELRQHLPMTKVILLSVLPSRRSDWVDAQTREINRLLATRFGGGDATFIDVTTAFVKNGTLDEAAFYDGRLNPPEPLLHPSPAGWMRMAEMAEPTLASLMGDARH